MTWYWVVLGLIIAIGTALICIVLFTRRSPMLHEDDLDFPLWEAEQFQQIDFWPELVERQRDDSAPVFMSPPEWGLAKLPQRSTR